LTVPLCAGDPAFVREITPVAAPGASAGDAVGGAAASAGRDPRALQRLRTASVLAAEGASIGLFVASLRPGDWLPLFVSENAIDDVLQSWMLVAAIGGAAALSGLLWFAITQRPEWEASLRWLARAAAWTLVLWAIPPLMSWRAWQERIAEVLVAAGATAVAFEALVRVTLEAFAEAAEGRSEGDLPRAVHARLAAVPRPRVNHPSWWVVGAATAGYAAYMSYYTLLNHWRLFTTTLDLGFFNQLFWNTLHGRFFYAPSAHPIDGSYLTQHAELIIFPLLPFYVLAPRAETLLVIQSCMLGVSAIPLFLFARRHVGDALGALVAVCFLLYPPVHGPNFYDFHFLTLATFFIFWAAYFLDNGRMRLFWWAFVGAMFCREDVCIGLTIMGVALALSGRLRTGGTMAAVAGSYFLVMKLLVMPRAGGNDESFLDYYGALVGPGQPPEFSSVLKTVLTNPTFAFAAMLNQRKLIYVLHVLVPLAFLPLRRAALLFFLLPGTVVTLLTNEEAITEIHYQYTTHFTPYAFLASVLVLEWLKQRGATHQRAAAAAMGLGTCLATTHFGALQQQHFEAAMGQVQFHFTDEDAKNLRDFRQLTALIPGDASVVATEHEGPQLSSRLLIFALRYGIAKADYVLFSWRSLGEEGASQKAVRKVLERGQYGVVSERPEFVLLQKGAPTEGNAAMLARVAALKEKKADAEDEKPEEEEEPSE
jgi:uncharacterized membrane protein